MRTTRDRIPTICQYLIAERTAKCDVEEVVCHCSNPISIDNRPYLVPVADRERCPCARDAFSGKHSTASLFPAQRGGAWAWLRAPQIPPLHFRWLQGCRRVCLRLPLAAFPAAASPAPTIDPKSTCSPH